MRLLSLEKKGSRNVEGKAERMVLKWVCSVMLLIEIKENNGYSKR